MTPRGIQRPKNKCGEYYRAWLLATGEMWRDYKDRRGPYRHVTHIDIRHRDDKRRPKILCAGA